MITPISPVKTFLNIRKYSKINKNNSDKVLNNFPCNKPQSVYFKGNYNFINHTPSFDETIEENYFKLPEITKPDGTKYQFKPDKSQTECARKLYNGDSVVFCAPTGTGKTAVACYVITKNLKEGKNTIYTTPLKALANDKMREFQKIYGKENVGLLTGDIKYNTDAPIKIMTTEIYNNQASSLKKGKDGIKTVIYDEAHYLGDDERGGVWENSMIKTPFSNIQMLCLSATIGNSDRLTEWLSSLDKSRYVSKVEVNPKNRYVPLVYSIYNTNTVKSADKRKFIPVIKGNINLESIQDSDIEDNDRLKRALEIFFRAKQDIDNYYEISNQEYKDTLNTLKNDFKEIGTIQAQEFQESLKSKYPFLTEEKTLEITEFLTEDKTLDKVIIDYTDDNYPGLVEDLKNNDMFPALIFKLSRSGTEDVISSLKDAECDLTTTEEKEQIKAILDKYKEEEIYLGVNFDKQGILSGYAYHHAGELPQYRKLIEELFSKKLIKVVSATSTLSAGINMPTKTVVLSNTAYKKYNPYSGEVEYVSLDSNKFHQMAGRAGRRGIDEIGHVVLYNNYTPKANTKIENLADKKDDNEVNRPDELRTAYDLILKGADNIQSRYNPDWHIVMDYFINNPKNQTLEEFLNSSFKVFLADNKEEELKKLTDLFNRRKNALIKLGFLEKHENGRTDVTPKGKILSMTRCNNPLVISSLIYDKKLKDMDFTQLCQIIGFSISPTTQQEDEKMEDFVRLRAELLLKDTDLKEEMLKFEQGNDMYYDAENKIYSTLEKSNVPMDDFCLKDSFSGFCSFAWAYLNSIDDNYIQNFRKITGSTKSAILSDKRLVDFFKQRNLRSEYLRKSNEGSVYDIISQTVTILKQINIICNYALDNPVDFPETKYWKDLKEKAELAILATKQNPIGDELQI